MVLFSNALLISNPLIFRVAVIALDPNSPREGGVLESLLFNLLGPSTSNLLIWIAILGTIAMLSALFKY